MQSGIYDAVSELDPSDLTDHGDLGPNAQEMLRTPLLAAHKAAKRGNKDARDALREIVQLVAEQLSAFDDVDEKLSLVVESLVGDGYELRFGLMNQWRKRNARLVPIEPENIPVTVEITALEAELTQRGYVEAREHYRLAVRHFSEQHHTSANGELRNMLESLIKALAIAHTGYIDTNQANQGGRAINTLYVKGGRPPALIGKPLPEHDGGGMLRGIWEIMHSRGPHAGLSDPDEARIRMQLGTALARFLLKHFPANS